MFLCQLDRTTRIATIHVARINNVPADFALLSQLCSQHWIRVGVMGL